MAEVSFGNGQVTLSRNLSAATNRDQDGSYFFSSNRNPEKGSQEPAYSDSTMSSVILCVQLCLYKDTLWPK